MTIFIACFNPLWRCSIFIKASIRFGAEFGFQGSFFKVNFEEDSIFSLNVSYSVVRV